ncbi:sulfite exporter TauE/SafE family protein [Flammeovirga sp. MY04]|uniref:sulfite exporter TauE/SafE family protein n=1 Tax=Flammeovirga sp. MY04 TaxID=1191459 RepID=UPI00080611A7|nr:sulfite exporter TauE/SafE family protein [Flammeovirga sp. MY04]ANQ51064.1 sulfite exporter TauE/SafE family protein [Flammeovirga sp. MY04]
MDYHSLDPLLLIAYITTGIIAGIVNTLAGGGSLFTLSLLMFIGMPVGLANGTNRLGILFQNVTGTYTFKKSNLLDIPSSMKYVIPSLLGAIVGALTVSDIDEKILQYIIGTLMLLMLYPILNENKKGVNLKVTATQKPQYTFWRDNIIFFCIGFYGGFVQAGIGIMILVSVSNLGKMTLIRANAIKMLIIAAYTLPVFIVFVIKGQVVWLAALLLAVGQVLGTWFAGKIASKSDKVNIFIRWLLVTMVVISIFRMFGIHTWLIDHLT